MLTDISFVVVIYVVFNLIRVITKTDEHKAIRRIVAPLALLLVLAFTVSMVINARDIAKEQTNIDKLFDSKID